MALASGPSLAHQKIDSSKSANHIGEEATVCGKVVEIKKISKGTYLNLGEKFPSQHIGILVWDSNQSGFTKKFGRLNTLQNKDVCASGLIESYRGNLQIKTSNPHLLNVKK